MTVYLLDTSTCVEYLRNRNLLVVRRILARPPQDIRLCPVVIAELYFGAYYGGAPAANLALLRRFIPQFQSLPLDETAAEEYGRIRADLTRRGTPIGANDLLTAAIAVADAATLVTHNTREFSRVAGLALEDWQV